MMYTNILYTYTRIILKNNNRHKRTNLSLSLSPRNHHMYSKTTCDSPDFRFLQVICIICILQKWSFPDPPRLTHDSQTEQTERRGFLTPLTELQDGRGEFGFGGFSPVVVFFGREIQWFGKIYFFPLHSIHFFWSLEDLGNL